MNFNGVNNFAHVKKNNYKANTPQINTNIGVQEKPTTTDFTNLLGFNNQKAFGTQKKAVKQPNGKVIAESNEQLKKIYENETSIKEKLQQAPNNSTGNQALQQQLTNLNNTKVLLIDKMANEFPAGSPDSNALKSTSRLVKEKFKADMISSKLAAIKDSKMDLNKNLQELPQNSSEAGGISNKMEALSQIEGALENQNSNSKNEVNKLNRDIKSNLSASTPEVTEIIDNIKASEAKNPSANDETKEKLNKEKQQTISRKLEELQEAKTELLPSTNEADTENQIPQQKLEALNKLENDLLNELKNTYSPGSKQAKAADAMININEMETQKDSSPDIAKNLSAEKAKLKRNILGSSTEDRKFLADIRADHLKGKNKLQQQKLNDMTKQLDNMKGGLKQENLSADQREVAQEQQEILRKDYLNERRNFKIDKDEEKFWTVIEKLPVNSLNNLYQMRS